MPGGDWGQFCSLRAPVPACPPPQTLRLSPAEPDACAGLDCAASAEAHCAVCPSNHQNPPREQLCVFISPFTSDSQEMGIWCVCLIVRAFGDRSLLLSPGPRDDRGALPSVVGRGGAERSVSCAWRCHFNALMKTHTRSFSGRIFGGLCKYPFSYSAADFQLMNTP